MPFVLKILSLIIEHKGLDLSHFFLLFLEKTLVIPSESEDSRIHPAQNESRRRSILKIIYLHRVLLLFSSISFLDAISCLAHSKSERISKGANFVSNQFPFLNIRGKDFITNTENEFLLVRQVPSNKFRFYPIELYYSPSLCMKQSFCWVHDLNSVWNTEAVLYKFTLED